MFRTLSVIYFFSFCVSMLFYLGALQVNLGSAHSSDMMAGEIEFCLVIGWQLKSSIQRSIFGDWS
jgi:hypothetical protein